jgi:hypothetical protein
MAGRVDASLLETDLGMKARPTPAGWFRDAAMAFREVVE